MNKACENNLNSIKFLLEKLNEHDFKKPIIYLNNGTIGQHVRHIIEFYSCFIDGIEDNHINYESRKRSLLLETDIRYCKKTIEDVISRMNSKIKEQRTIIVRYNMSIEEKNFAELVSNSLRELMYCLEHSIHHQALIKVALIELGKSDLVDSNFGLAYATIRKNNQCAQ